MKADMTLFTLVVVNILHNKIYNFTVAIILNSLSVVVTNQLHMSLKLWHSNTKNIMKL